MDSAGAIFILIVFVAIIVVINRLIRKGGECWREQNNKPDQEEAVASS